MKVHAHACMHVFVCTCRLTCVCLLGQDGGEGGVTSLAHRLINPPPQHTPTLPQIVSGKSAFEHTGHRGGLTNSEKQRKKNFLMVRRCVVCAFVFFSSVGCVRVCFLNGWGDAGPYRSAGWDGESPTNMTNAITITNTTTTPPSPLPFQVRKGKRAVFSKLRDTQQVRALRAWCFGAAWHSFLGGGGWVSGNAWPLPTAHTRTPPDNTPHAWRSRLTFLPPTRVGPPSQKTNHRSARPGRCAGSSPCTSARPASAAARRHTHRL